MQSQPLVSNPDSVGKIKRPKISRADKFIYGSKGVIRLQTASPPICFLVQDRNAVLSWKLIRSELQLVCVCDTVVYRCRD